MIKRCIFCHQYRILNDIGECHECEQARLENESEQEEQPPRRRGRNIWDGKAVAGGTFERGE